MQYPDITLYTGTPTPEPPCTGRSPGPGESPEVSLERKQSFKKGYIYYRENT